MLFMNKCLHFSHSQSSPQPLSQRERGLVVELSTAANPIYLLGKDFQPEAEDTDAEDAEDEPERVHPFAQ